MSDETDNAISESASNHSAFVADFPNRRFIYTDVEELVSHGFLSCDVCVSGVNLSLRSTFSDDHRLLVSRVGNRGTVRLWKEWAVAATTWLVDGQVLLGEHNTAPYVRSMLCRLPDNLIDILYAQYAGLFNRLTEALNRVEAYCYEEQSRGLWRLHGRTFPQTLGLGSCQNAVQRMWVAYNLAEDDRIARQEQWISARFVASAHNPKGVKQVASKDDMHQNMELSRRHSVVGSLYLKLTGRSSIQRGPKRAISVEDLVEEMARYRRGEKDEHDMIVEREKERIRNRYRQEEQQHEARMAELAEAGLNMPLLGGTQDSMVGLTLEQLREIQGSGPSGHRRTVSDTGNRDRLYERYVKNEIPVGTLRTDGTAAVDVPATNGSRESDRGGPVGDNSVPLSERIGNRRVVLLDDGE